jgi:hypothetical protein
MQPIWNLHIFSLCLAALLSGCGSGDYERQLPNGYYLMRTNANTVAIWSQNRQPSLAVPPRIIKIAVLGNLIIGETEYSQASELAEQSITGFFILDTGTNFVKTGLSNEQWRAQLRERGVKSIPQLTEPIQLK